MRKQLDVGISFTTNFTDIDVCLMKILKLRPYYNNEYIVKLFWWLRQLSMHPRNHMKKFTENNPKGTCTCIFSDTKQPINHSGCSW